MRLRLYSRQGLAPGEITRIISFSILTNWLGYLLLASLVFSLQPPALPGNWNIHAGQLRFIGMMLLALAGAYLACCAWVRQRHFLVRGHAIDLPPLRLAALQMLAGAANWLVISGIVFILLQHQVAFPAVVAVLLLAAMADVIVRVPANLGVLEAVFTAMLSGAMPEHDILAALVAHRMVYYLIPLALAALACVVLEILARKKRKNSRSA